MTINIEQDLASILDKLDQKLDKLDDKFERKLDKVSEDISEIKTDLSEVKTEVAVIKANQDNFSLKLSEITGSQKSQIWSLIVLLAGTLISITIAYFRVKQIN